VTVPQAQVHPLPAVHYSTPAASSISRPLTNDNCQTQTQFNDS